MALFDAFRSKRSERPPPGLEERLDRVERGLRAIDEDLSDLHDRFQRFQGRTSKRRAIDEKAAEAEAPPAERGFRPRVYGVASDPHDRG